MTGFVLQGHKHHSVQYFCEFIDALNYFHSDNGRQLVMIRKE